MIAHGAEKSFYIIMIYMHFDIFTRYTKTRICYMNIFKHTFISYDHRDVLIYRCNISLAYDVYDGSSQQTLDQTFSIVINNIVKCYKAINTNKAVIQRLIAIFLNNVV